MDMRFHWMQDRVVQKQYKVIWQPGHDNTADYYTKVHPPAHHRRRRHLYVDTLPIGRHFTNQTKPQANGVCYS